MAHTDICPASKWPVPQIRAPTARVRGWLLLGAWIAAIAVFVPAAGPALLQRCALQPMAQLIDDLGIEACSAELRRLQAEKFFAG
ncbi:MAG: hypothetical protein P8X55_15695 [Desulfosarcinaceae bacterium]